MGSNTLETVLTRLRVSTSELGVGKKGCTTYNGILANSWFSPYGIQYQTKHMDSQSIRKELENGIQKRAKSASAIVGRKHYERQDIGKEECIEGKALFQRDSIENFATNNNHKTKQGRFCGNFGESSYRDYKAKILSRRPETSYGARKGKNETAKQKEHKLDMEGKKYLEWIKLKKDAQKDLACYKCREQLQSRDDIDSRARSAPADMMYRYHQEYHSVREEGCKTPKTPLYWKTRSDYQKKQLVQKKGDLGDYDVIFIPRGSLLKPMMYATDKPLKHSAGCPYKCKGCFKACLASSDYIENVWKRKTIAVENDKHVKSKFYHRRIVEMALARSQPIQDLIVRR